MLLYWLDIATKYFNDLLYTYNCYTKYHWSSGLNPPPLLRAAQWVWFEQPVRESLAR